MKRDGYIVNKTSKQVNLDKATISLSNFSTNINNTISKQKIFSELNQPVKISPKSRKIVNLNSKVKYTSTPNMFGSIEFISNPTRYNCIK